ncbi:MFS transporter [Acinetobacter courvalinii]|uniref:MFS transporter n=1 Tax=Acinetobacter courvalinii TaxID=280147 RepID=UPI0021CF5F87|nr:MFS transporter [Acinetobacter courvalinii]MCU4578343.1 MFS transporter [Acinetobacter courvalinii]
MNNSNLYRIVLLMFATSLGYLVVQLDVSIVNISLPNIQVNLGAKLSELQWIVNVYVLLFASMLLSSGVLGDRYGSKRLLICGYSVFMTGSVLCALSSSITIMLIARAIQGIGAAVIVPNSLAIINKTFSDNPKLRTTLITLWMAFGGIALTSGPILGGLITSTLSWHYIFLINIPICLLGLYFTIKYVKKDIQIETQKNDILGQFLIFLSSLASLMLIINFKSYNWIQLILLSMSVIVTLLLFFKREKNFFNPAIPLEIFKNIELQRALSYGFLVNFIYFGIIFFMSLYFVNVMNFTPLQAGIAFVPFTIPLIAANIISGKLSNKYYSLLPINVGIAFMLVGMVALAMPITGTNYTFMLPALISISIGVGLITPMITTIAMLSIDQKKSGMISAVVNFFRQISGAFGVAIFGLFVDLAIEHRTYLYFQYILLITIACFILSYFYFTIKCKKSQSIEITN